MKKQKTHALIIVFLITIIQLGNYAFAQNVFPTPVGNVGINLIGAPFLPLQVRGDVQFIDVGSAETINFTRPGAENGFTFLNSSSRADIRYNGTTLRLLATNSLAPPSLTSGISIDNNFGWVGLGTSIPQCRLQLNDFNSSSFGSYINTNSIGPTLFIERNLSGSSNPVLPWYITTNTGNVFLNSLYSGTSLGSMTCAYFENTDPDANYSIGITVKATSNNANPLVQSFTSTGVNTLAEKALISMGTLSVANGYLESYGIKAEGSNGSTNDYGVYGLGIGNGCSDVYGVYGEANAGKNNYGIYGIANANPSCDNATAWAGYFAGNVTAVDYYKISDKKFKENIKPIENVLDIISKLNPQTYTFKNSDDFLGLSLPEGLKYGFIAQELETILPTLVKKSHNPEIKDKDGKIISKSVDYKSVDYISIIPILVEGVKEQQIQIKEQQAQIEELKTQMKNNLNISKSNNNGTPNDLSEAILYQNSPNPFSENTTIKYHLANAVDAASIMVFDMNGKLLKTYELNTQNVDGDVQISSGTLIAGMYYYSLVVKGKEISTLKMILAK